MSEPVLTHLDERGNPRMVDVGEKEITRRRAVAEGWIETSPETLAAISGGAVAKGNVLVIAQLAGIQGAKRTADLIPLCHPLALSSVRITLGRFTTEVEVNYAAQLIRNKVEKLRELSPLWEMYQDGVDLNSVQWAAH